MLNLRDKIFCIPATSVSWGGVPKQNVDNFFLIFNHGSKLKKMRYIGNTLDAAFELKFKGKLPINISSLC